jgi:SAM-dependent methyltransferase
MVDPLPSEVQRFVAATPVVRTPIALAVARAAQRLPAGTAVLDAGAGEAPYRRLFDHCEYRTQDWPGSVHPGSREASIVADLHSLPIEDASFDFVLCTEVLEHVRDPAQVATELRRVLRDGGTLLVTVPFVGELHEEPHDYRRFTNHGVEGLLLAAGFDDVRAEPLTGYYSTIIHLFRHSGLATRPRGGSQRPTARAMCFTLLAVSRVLQAIASRLDNGLDQRRALPVGWLCQGRAATSSPSD